MATSSSELHAYIFQFERDFNQTAAHNWMVANWTTSFWYSLVYVVLIGGGKYLMNNRPRFEIRTALVLWSSVLALFSILGTIRVLPEFIQSVTDYGLKFSMCNNNHIFQQQTSFWMYIFAISKVFELGDTVFIILRKQQLIFLHWYHHITVLIYCWYSYPDQIGATRWFAVMNYVVHSFMYTYYTLKALQFRIPKWVSMAITLLQLIQMIIGLSVSIYTYNLMANGEPCHQTYDNFKYSLLMYLSYFILFCNFFYAAYFKSLGRPSVLKSEVTGVHKTNQKVKAN